MNNICTLIVLLFTIQLSSQNVSNEDCFVTPMYTGSDVPASFSHGELTEYFLSRIAKDFFIKCSDNIIIQVLIDSSGNPCLKSAVNSENIEFETLKSIIGKMPRWNPAKNEDKSINVSQIIELVIDDGTLKEARLQTISKGDKQKKLYGPESSDELEEALDNIETITTLTLYGQELELLDPRIGELKNVKQLYLGANKFESIPEELFSLTNLEQLLLDSNNLIEIPPAIGKLESLMFLILNGNKIEKLPNEISNLKRLLYIDLSDNPISEEEIERIKKLIPRCEIRR